MLYYCSHYSLFAYFVFGLLVGIGVTLATMYIVARWKAMAAAREDQTKVYEALKEQNKLLEGYLRRGGAGRRYKYNLSIAIYCLNFILHPLTYGRSRSPSPDRRGGARRRHRYVATYT